MVKLQRVVSLLLFFNPTDSVADDINPDDSLRYVTRIIESGRGWCDPMHFDPHQAAKVLGDPKVSKLRLEKYTISGSKLAEALMKKKAQEHGWGDLKKDEQDRLAKGVMTDEESQLLGKLFSLIVSKRGDRCFSNKLAIVHSRSLKGYEAMRGFNAGLWWTLHGVGAC